MMREAKHHLGSLVSFSLCAVRAFGRTEGHAVLDVHTRVVGVRTHACFVQNERLAAAPGTSHQICELPNRLHGPATTQTDRQAAAQTHRRTKAQRTIAIMSSLRSAVVRTQIQTGEISQRFRDAN